MSMGMDEVLKAVRPFAKVDDATWDQVEKHVAEHGLTGAAGSIVRAAVEKAGDRSAAGLKAAQSRWGNRSGGDTEEASPRGRAASETRWSESARAQNEGRNDKAPEAPKPAAAAAPPPGGPPGGGGREAARVRWNQGKDPKDLDNKDLMTEIDRVDREMGRMPAGPKGADAPKYNAFADRLSSLMGEADGRGWVDGDGNFTGKAPRR